MPKFKIMCLDEDVPLTERQEELIYEGCIKTKQFVELAFSLGFILSIEYEDEYEERTLH